MMMHSYVIIQNELPIFFNNRIYNINIFVNNTTTKFTIGFSYIVLVHIYMCFDKIHFLIKKNELNKRRPYITLNQEN